MSVLLADMTITWNVEVWGAVGNSAKKAAFSHSTFQGMLLSKEDLQKTRPDFVPKLNARGEARRSVLELCDGRKPLEEVEREVCRRHPKLFRSSAEAAKFVAEVITSYTS
jgi:hypothetical protein